MHPRVVRSWNIGRLAGPVVHVPFSTHHWSEAFSRGMDAILAKYGKKLK